MFSKSAKRVLLIAVVAFVLLASYNLLSVESKAIEKSRIKREFRSAEYCGQCHDKEYEQWNRSAHSRSLVGETFQQLFQQSIKETSGQTRAVCLRCHAPAAVFNNDPTINDSMNAKPVNCEVCHAMVHTNNTQKLKFDTSGKMFSADNANLGSGHEVQKSNYITTVQFCAPCHTQTHSTEKFLSCAKDISYDSWKSITGRTDRCQDCHMRDLYGDVDHSFPGAHDKEMVEGSLEVRWNLTQTTTLYKVRTILHNANVGHEVPAGMTLRRLIVRIRVLDKDGEEIYKQDAVLGRVFEDKDGIWPVMGWNAKKIRFDTSIRPLEKRMIMFNVPLIRRGRYIELTVIYKLTPDADESFIIFADRKRL